MMLAAEQGRLDVRCWYMSFEWKGSSGSTLFYLPRTSSIEPEEGPDRAAEWKWV